MESFFTKLGWEMKRKGLGGDFIMLEMFVWPSNSDQRVTFGELEA